MPNEERTDVVVDDAIANNIWGDNPAPQPVQQPAPVEPPKNEPAQPQPTQPTSPQVPTFDVNAYLKENFGFDSPDVAKETIEKWRKAESEPKQPLEPTKPTFANEESERVFNLLKEGKAPDAIKYYNKLAEIDNAEKLQPIDAIKLNLKYKNEHYSPADIDDVIEEKYVLPKKPKESDFTDDEEYKESLAQYEKDAAKVQRRIERDSKDAIKELQQSKKDLVLPDINNDSANYKAFLKQQEDLQKEEDAIKSNYKQVLKNDSGKFDAYTTVYKDKDVEVPISYKPTEEELKSLENKFENDFDADEFLAQRWFKMDGDKVVGHNIQQQKADVYLLENRQKIFDRIASDAYNKAIDNFIKKEKNINFKQENPVPDEAILNKQQALDKQLTDNLWGKTG